MNCRNQWDRRFLSQAFPKTFLTKNFKQHRANVLFEREKSLFPETMASILEDQRREALKERLIELRRAQSDIQRQIETVQQQLYRRATTTTTHEKITFVRPCVHDGCKGYISETNGQCGLCQHFTCVECNVALSTETRHDHTCREEDCQNWVFIRQSSKPCPSCHVRIHRISGCRQMWCPQCHTAFDYVTGKIERGIIHNPHYFDYVRRNGHDHNHHHIDENPCGNGNRLVTFFQLQRMLVKLGHKTQQDEWTRFYRFVAHIQRVELPKLLRYRDTPFHTTTLVLRKLFMKNMIDENQFKKRLQEYEKKWNKMRLLYEIYECVENVGRRLLWEMTTDGDTKKDELLTERNELRNFFNDSINDLNFQYQSTLPCLDEQFHLY
jgi:hypothetical protein